MHPVFRIALLAGLAACELHAAEAPCRVPSAECIEVGQFDLSVSMGAGTRTNPIAGAGDIPLLLIPKFSYYGKRFFIDNLEVGFTLYEGESSMLNLVTSPGYDRVFFYRHDLQNVVVPLVGGADNPSARLPVPRRRTTFLAGPEWLFDFNQWSGQLSALYEATGRHKGYEVRGALAAPLVESKGTLNASIGFTWKSTELVGYYYGVDDLYQPGSALNPFAKLAYALPLTDRWSFTASAHYEHLDDTIADSPLVSDKGVATVFAGFACRVF